MMTEKVTVLSENTAKYANLRITLVNVKAPVVATTNWLWLISALVLGEDGRKVNKIYTCWLCDCDISAIFRQHQWGK